MSQCRKCIKVKKTTTKPSCILSFNQPSIHSLFEQPKGYKVVIWNLTCFLLPLYRYLCVCFCMCIFISCVCALFNSKFLCYQVLMYLNITSYNKDFGGSISLLFKHKKNLIQKLLTVFMVVFFFGSSSWKK